MKIMTFTFLSLYLFFSVSCSLDKTKNSESLTKIIPNENRDIASVSMQNTCKIENNKKDKTKFRVLINDNPYNKFWYQEKFAMDLKQYLIENGQCN